MSGRGQRDENIRLLHVCGADLTFDAAAVLRFRPTSLSFPCAEEASRCCWPAAPPSSQPLTTFQVGRTRDSRLFTGGGGEKEGDEAGRVE